MNAQFGPRAAGSPLDSRAGAAGSQDAGRPGRRPPRHPRRARPRRLRGQQVRRRRGHAARAVSARPAVVAGGPPSAAARHCCPSDASPAMLPGAKIPPTGAITAPSAARPLNQATGCGGTTISTISSSRSTTTPARGSPAAAARCSCIVARPNGSPTAGCVALRASDLRRLLTQLGPETRIAIQTLMPPARCGRRRSPCPPARGSHRTRSRAGNPRSCPWTVA